MNISAILEHPYKYNFNAAIAAVAAETLNKQGHHILFHDLYGKQFNPVLSDTELVSNVPEDTLTAFLKNSFHEKKMVQ